LYEGEGRTGAGRVGIEAGATETLPLANGKRVCVSARAPELLPPPPHAAAGLGVWHVEHTASAAR